MYDNLGNMAVQAMHDPRPLFAPGHTLPLGTCTLEEVADAYRGYYAYFGTYVIDSGKDAIIHHVEGSLSPPEVGISYTRFVSLTDDSLVLQSPPIELKGEVLHSRLTWKRAPRSQPFEVPAAAATALDPANGEVA